jgi:hypothetical protein
MAFPVEKAIKTTIIGLLRTFGPNGVCKVKNRLIGDF